MLFDSLDFAAFFSVFLFLYYLVRHSLPLRNTLIVIASFFFYGYWDIRFLALLVATATLDFLVALKIQSSSPTSAKRWLICSLIANLGVLGFFKYCNFFVDSLREALLGLGFSFNTATLSIVLPIGISFYTFQSMSYVIDVYRKTIPPSRNLIEFLAYISFFPQLVAGPIERAGHLLPQFQTPRLITSEHLRDGIALTLFGFFKKIVIADNLAPFVQLAYGHPDPGASLMIAGTIAFAFQIYCDFSGYSDIARGTAKLLGFEIMQNFNLPYFATTLTQFWQRWHISLSTWFRDYLYIPLGGNRRGLSRTCFNLFIVMLLAGLWHGARFNFLLWGLWHALGLIACRLWLEFKPRDWKIPAALSWLLTFFWIIIGWIFFRSENVEQLYRCFTALTEFSQVPWFPYYLSNLALLCLPLVLFQAWQQKHPQYLSSPIATFPRAIFQALLLTTILVFAQRDELRPFIYFQF